MNEKFKPLFKEFSFKNMTVKNRIVMAPMTNFLSEPDGTVTENELNYYGRRSDGPGMVITACTYTVPNGKGFPGEFAGDRDEMIPSLKNLADTIKGKGAKAVLQIFHGGRECPPNLVPDGDVVSASDVKSSQAGERKVPRPLTSDEIHEIIKSFGETTRRAIEAGYDGVEIHGANGYLLQQFFSAESNLRDDEWGGSLEKRMKFPLAVVDEVKKAAEKADRPFLVGYRFSPEEPYENGITMDETLALLDELSKKDLDYLHVSLMEYNSKVRRGADIDRSRLEVIQERVGEKVPVIGVGSVYTADDALKTMESGVPLVAIGRGLIIEPDWVQKVESGRENEIETELDLEAQDRLVVPDPLWNAIVNSPGWFPGVK
ncbi:NADH-dependent flavin oxidoreductase [Falsibacillus pallidus]|uniref:2,4-dienoyl-CoA reductase-like NADH-dependent reductase (Old Yellow Enzyme family) n=1 Tax=Falsibacillus pallidus TaxID=493781 RepID=A0A370GQ32_9BACI|nr:NADH-dependent flavin oxidoreductase [Falsibacillus pallidus]RDI45621.1 2,4-dienoyl-CoA reductase-like NADH-dependent reductase (Old Yellow Enzyme family) [Falsibacillus pallidus]